MKDSCPLRRLLLLPALEQVNSSGRHLQSADLDGLGVSLVADDDDDVVVMAATVVVATSREVWLTLRRAVFNAERVVASEGSIRNKKLRL